MPGSWCWASALLGPQVHGLAVDHPLVQVHVDVAAADDDRSGARIVHETGQERRDAGGTGPLDHLFFLPIGVADGVADLAFAHQVHAVHQIAHQGEAVAVVQADPAAQSIGRPTVTSKMIISNARCMAAALKSKPAKR